MKSFKNSLQFSTYKPWFATGLLALSTATTPDVATAQENTRNGAVIGVVTGAVIGGVVGHNHKDQTAEGALIGGAVGAVAGGIFGNQRDKLERQRRAYEQQKQQFYQQQTYAQLLSLSQSLSIKWP